MYGKKVIKRDIYQIIIPMILENILQISANLVITAMVGRLLANDISAQGICIRIHYGVFIREWQLGLRF